MTRRAQSGTPSEQSSDIAKDSAMSTFSSQQNSGQFINPNVFDLDQNHSANDMANQAIAMAQYAVTMAAESFRMANQATDMAARASALAEQARRRQGSVALSEASTSHAQSPQSVLGSLNSTLPPILPTFKLPNSPVPSSNPFFPIRVRSSANTQQPLPPSAEGFQPMMPAPFVNIAPRPWPPPPPQQQAEQMQGPYFQDYQFQLMMLEQQNKKRLAENADRDAADLNPLASPPYQQDQAGRHRHQDYQMQLMLLEQQNKKRLRLKAEKDAACWSGAGNGSGAGGST